MWANWWVIFKSIHYGPVGWNVSELFQKSLWTHHVPTGYLTPRPQWLEPCPHHPHLNNFTFSICLFIHDFNRILWPKLKSNPKHHQLIYHVLELGNLVTQTPDHVWLLISLKFCLLKMLLQLLGVLPSSLKISIPGPSMSCSSIQSKRTVVLSLKSTTSTSIISTWSWHVLPTPEHPSVRHCSFFDLNLTKSLTP